MHHYKRLTSVLCALLVCSVLSGCGMIIINHRDFGNETSQTEDAGTTASVETTTAPQKVQNDYSEKIDSLLASLGENNYAGAAVKIVSPDTSYFDPDSSPEYMSKAIEKRNARLKEKFGVNIVSAAVDYGAYHDELYGAVRSGEYYADLIVIPQCFLGSFSADGLLMNLRSLPGLDFDAEYFNKSSVNAGAGGFYSYALSGEALETPLTLPAVFFNKDICANLSLTSPYDLVSAGAWTWDKMFEYCTAVSGAEGLMGWGSTYIGQGVYEAMYVSCGRDMISSGVMSVPQYMIDAEACADAFSVIEKLSWAPVSYGSYAAITDFTANTELFHIDAISAICEICVSPVNFGIVPMPVVNSGDTYRSLANENSLMFACPATVATPDKSSTVLMGLNAASYGDVRDSVVSYYQFRYLRDNRSANMLDIILKSAVFDFSYSYGGYYEQLAHGTYALIRDYALDRPELPYIISINYYPVVNLLNSRFGTY